MKINGYTPEVIIDNLKDLLRNSKSFVAEPAADSQDDDELALQAQLAAYPDFGLVSPQPGSEEKHYGKFHPLQKALKSPGEIIALLKAGDYAALERYFGLFQTGLESGDFPEGLYADAINDEYFDESLPEDIRYLDAWVAQKPASFLAHGMRGLFLSKLGWNARGGNYVNDTPKENFVAMEDFLEASQESLATAVTLNPKFLAGHYQRISNAKTIGKAESFRLFTAAEEVFPASYVLREIYMDMLKPRWGGSYLAMRMFALQSQQHVNINPRLQMLLGLEAHDKGLLLDDDDQDQAALVEFNNALYHGIHLTALYRSKNSRGVGPERTSR